MKTTTITALLGAAVLALCTIQAQAYESYAVDQGKVDEKSMKQTDDWDRSLVNVPALALQGNSTIDLNTVNSTNSVAIESCLEAVGVVSGGGSAGGLFGGNGILGTMGFGNGMGVLSPATSFSGGLVGGGLPAGGLPGGGLPGGGGFGGSFGF